MEIHVLSWFIAGREPQYGHLDPGQEQDTEQGDDHI